MALTKNQIKQIQKIIREHMEVLGLLFVGEGKPSPSLINNLKLPKEIKDLITSSYKYGKLSAVQGKDLSTMSDTEVNKLLKNLKLTKAQQRSVEYSKIKAQQYIDAMTQRITTNIVSATIQSNFDMWSAVKEVIPDSLENGTPRHQVIQKLREMTGDMERDWHRVAHTEMWSAKCHGEVDAMMAGESPLTNKGADTKVYIKPAHNACNKCKQLYLESDRITPRVFSLSELIANGSNQGKKQADWKATVPCLHPKCMCVLNVKPDDTEFDSQGNLIYSPK